VTDNLQLFVDGEHREIRERVRGILSRPGFGEAGGLSIGEYRERVLEWARELADEGGTSLGFPSEFGGMDMVGGSIVSFETLALGDLSLLVKCGVQFGLFGGAVLHLGTRKHHERYLHDIATLKLPGCFAMTETGHGSDVQSLGTTATYDASAGEFVINTPTVQARKDYIGNAACHGRIAAVFAQLHVGDEEHGVHALLVPIRDDEGNVLPGIEIEDDGPKVGLNGVDNGRISFDHVRVPRDALLDRFGKVGEDGVYSSPIEKPTKRFFSMLGTLVQGRISISAGSLSAAKTALTIAVRHNLRRRQFAVPGSDGEILLLDYRTQQRRLLPALARVYALHFAQVEVISRLDRIFGMRDEEAPERDRRELETWAAGIKATASWHAMETIQTCRECCGGVAYLSENRFGELRDDTDIFTTFEGDNTVLMQLVAKSVLTDYRDDFSNLNPIGTAGFIASHVVQTVAERTGLREIAGRLLDDLTPGREDEGDLGDRSYHLALFHWREQHITAGAARRIKRGVDDGVDPAAVLIDAQDHVVAIARAHVDRLILEAFAAAIERCEDEEVRELLNRVCDLYALVTIENDRAWFQEHGRISSTRAKLITRAVNRLCGELREDAGRLVDGFGIPDAVLRAPIGLKG
jgi:acyl-CoA oxidase